MRRAISAHAALRWAESSSVMSSKVTTNPLISRAVSGDQLYLGLREPIRAAFRLVEQFRHIGGDFGEVLPDRLLEIDPE
jgi:hypothetical protein